MTRETRGFRAVGSRHDTGWAHPAANALVLAHRLHEGQVDKAGHPYVLHLMAVVGILLRDHPAAPAHAVEAAWLHDALEDTAATPAFLLASGVSPPAVDLVGRLTRPEGMAYLDWIGGIARGGDPWAIRVKLADVESNTDPARRIPGADALERRYASARRLLEEALADGQG